MSSIKKTMKKLTVIILGKIFFCIVFCKILCITGANAGENILPALDRDLINPYKKESVFRLIKVEQPVFGRIQPDFYNKLTEYPALNNALKTGTSFDYISNADILPSVMSADTSRYDNVLSRMEREWLHRENRDLPVEERLNLLEEKVFGTLHEGGTDIRCSRLQKAFNARKSIQAKHNRTGRNLFSGVPTSIPVNADELFNQE